MTPYEFSQNSSGDTLLKNVLTSFLLIPSFLTTSNKDVLYCLLSACWWHVFVVFSSTELVWQQYTVSGVVMTSVLKKTSVACNFAIFKNKAFHDIFSMAQNNFEIVFFISLFLVFFISKFLSLTTKLWYSRTLRCLINRPEAA